MRARHRKRREMAPETRLRELCVWLKLLIGYVPALSALNRTIHHCTEAARWLVCAGSRQHQPPTMRWSRWWCSGGRSAGVSASWPSTRRCTTFPVGGAIIIIVLVWPAQLPSLSSSYNHLIIIIIIIIVRPCICVPTTIQTQSVLIPQFGRNLS
jgi:hypothetical protein